MHQFSSFNCKFLRSSQTFLIVIFIGIVPFVTYCQQFSFQQKIASENRQMFSLFGFSATFYKKYLMIGSPLSEDVTYLYEKKLNTWELIQTLTPSDPTVNKYFGFSTYMNDSIIIIGAVGDNNARGAAYFYEKDVTGLWIEKQKLIPPVVLFDVENFGSSVTIFKNRLIIVAPRDNHDAFESNPIFETGSAYVFERDISGTWIYINQKLVAPIRSQDDFFGTSIVCSEENVFISSFRNDYNINENGFINDAGAVYVFDIDTMGKFFLKQKIVSSNRILNGFFGLSMAATNDYILIGESGDGLNPTTSPHSGAAYIYTKDANSGLWVEHQKLTPSDGQNADRFGYRVAFSGNYAVIGAFNQDYDELNNTPLSDAGATYIYKRNASDVWIEVQKIVAPDRAIGDNFGSAVAIWDSTILVVARYEDEDENGQNTLTDASSAYIFEACPASIATETQIACGSYIWIDGLTYTSSTQDETFTIPNTLGCDSIITLNLTVHPIDSIIEAVVECDVYNWNSLSLTQSGSYVSKGKNQYGCDSTFTLNLTIHNSTNNMEQKSACDSIIWNGTTYDNSGIHTYTTTNTYNCDSTETLNLTIYPSSQKNINFTTCDAYTWNGQTYAQSGIYTYPSKNIYGCDSITTLNLTIHPTITETIQETQCDAYTWNGTTYTQSGSYDYQTLSVLNCDSIATLALTIHPSSQESISYSSCDPYLWNGTTYTESGTYTYQSQNMFGCDSTTTLDLTIHPNSNNTTTQTACDTYFWSGTTYDQSGTYSTASTNVFGCDSISTLNLTIHPSQNISTTETACGTFVWQGNVYDQSGVYTYQTQNSFGCDSTITLNLTIHPESSTDITTTACDSLIYQGQTITESGTYTFDLQSKNGCDSTINLNLTISADKIENTQSVCGTYLWPVTGEAYTQSGTYQALYTNALGCDSTYRLDLTIHPEYNQETTAEACAKYLWSLNNQTYTQSGQHSVTLRTQEGCDSIITLDVTIHPEFEYRDTVITNEPYLWPINNTVYETSGIYTETFSTDVRCDSIHYLYLTISVDTDIHVPNIISPDGPNSQFTFYGSSISIIQDLSVYDRWGNQVFHRKAFPPNDSTQGWDGKYQGKNLTPGVYTYSAQLILTDGTIISKYGDVTIIR
jgi:hypothetical protein